MECELKPYIGRARIDMTSIAIVVDAAPIEAYLSRRYPLTIRDIRGVGAGKHVICVELWCVRDGRAEASGIDQHGWMERSGSVLGIALGAHTGAILGSTYGGAVAATVGGVASSWLGPIGMLWGASAGWFGGAASGGLAGAWAGGSIGDNMMQRAARRTSEIAARSFGTYHETAVLIPNVVHASGSGFPHRFVVGMLTDSALSKIEADVYGQGFSKQVATVSCKPFQEWNWTDEKGHSILAARFADRGSDAFPLSDTAAFSEFEEWSCTPFLGPSMAGALVATDVDQFVDNEAERKLPTEGELVAGDIFGDVLESRSYGFGPGKLCAGTAVHLENVLVRVTGPRPFE